MDFRTKVVHDGSKNTSVQISGWAPCSWIVAVNASALIPIPRDLRIDAVYYAISDGVEVLVGWGDFDEPQACLPLGGRGRIDFGEVSGLHNTAERPDGNILIQATGKGLFTLVLDLSKHTGG